MAAARDKTKLRQVNPIVLPRSMYLVRAVPFVGVAFAIACATYSTEPDASGDGGTSASSSSSSSSSGATSTSSSASSSGASSSGDAGDAKTTVGPCTTVADCDDKNTCTTDACNVVGICEHTTKSFDDQNACTTDTCTPTSGIVHTPIVACSAQSDGCCPSGCTTATDPDCLSCTNLATTATPDSDSPARGSFDYGPINLNDGLITGDCTKYCWAETAQGTGASFTYTWPNAVKVASMVIVSNPQTNCGSGSHILSGGTVETWNGNAWQPSVSFNNKSGKYTIDLPTPVVTTKVRITNTQVVGFNPQMYEWAIFNKSGCSLP